MFKGDSVLKNKINKCNVKSEGNASLASSTDNAPNINDSILIN